MLRYRGPKKKNYYDDIEKIFFEGTMYKENNAKHNNAKSLKSLKEENSSKFIERSSQGNRKVIKRSWKGHRKVIKRSSKVH